MTVRVRITGVEPEAAAAEAADLLRLIGDAEPAVVPMQAADEVPRDMATGIALVSLVLAVPGAALAALDLRDRLTRREVSARVEAAKAALATGKLEAELEIDGIGRVDLARQPVDAIVDRIIGDPPS